MSAQESMEHADHATEALFSGFAWVEMSASAPAGEVVATKGHP